MISPQKSNNNYSCFSTNNNSNKSKTRMLYKKKLMMRGIFNNKNKKVLSKTRPHRHSSWHINCKRYPISARSTCSN